MSSYRTRNQIVLLKREAVSGTEETPTPAADAILVENPQWSPNFEVEQTNEVTGSLDGRGPIVGGGHIGITFEALVKGAGAGGSAPEYGDALRCCAMSETITAVAVTGTAQAGAAGSITLHAGASAVDNFYKGMIIRTTGGTGSGQTRVITGYTGSSKVATVTPNWTVTPDVTTTFSIDANVLYKPASTLLETATIWNYQNPATAIDSLLRKVTAAAGTMRISAETRKIARMAFTFRGFLPGVPTNVAAPAAATYDATRPAPFISADIFLGQLAVKLRSWTIDYGAVVQQADDPAALYGFGIAGQTERRIIGELNPLQSLLSVYDAMADFTVGTERALWIRWGSANNRVSILLPAVRATGAEPSDTDGFAATTVPFESVGIDSGIYLSVS